MASTTNTADFETLLRQALAPVEPPPDLEQRLETTLDSLVGLAADELEGWELRAMKDPRNWGRPAAAVVVGTSATVGLVLLRAQRKASRRRAAAANPLDLAERTLRDVADEARRVLDRR